MPNTGRAISLAGDLGLATTSRGPRRARRTLPKPSTRTPAVDNEPGAQCSPAGRYWPTRARRPCR